MVGLAVLIALPFEQIKLAIVRLVLSIAAVLVLGLAIGVISMSFTSAANAASPAST